MAKAAVYANESLILELRSNVGLTQLTLAKKAGVSRGVIQRIEKGEKTTRQTLDKIAEVLMVKADQLIAKKSRANAVHQAQEQDLQEEWENRLAQAILSVENEMRSKVHPNMYGSIVQLRFEAFERLGIVEVGGMYDELD